MRLKHRASGPPVVDFDTNAPSAGINTLGLLLLPPSSTAEDRLEASRQWFSLLYANRMRELGEKAYTSLRNVRKK